MINNVPVEALILGIAPSVTGLILFFACLYKNRAIFSSPFALVRKDKEVSVQANLGSVVMILSVLLATIPAYLLYQMATRDNTKSDLEQFRKTASEVKEQLDLFKGGDLRVRLRFSPARDDEADIQYEVQQKDRNGQRPYLNFREDRSGYLVLWGLRPGDKIQVNARVAKGEDTLHAWSSKFWTVPEPELYLTGEERGGLK